MPKASAVRANETPASARSKVSFHIIRARGVLAIHPEIANINTGLRMLQDEGQAFAFGTLSAVILLAMIPTLVVFVLLQRHYVRGVSEGAFAGF